VSADIAERLTLAVDETRGVSALLQLPPAATTCFVLAHGAGTPNAKLELLADPPQQAGVIDPLARVDDMDTVAARILGSVASCIGQSQKGLAVAD